MKALFGKELRFIIPSFTDIQGLREYLNSRCWELREVNEKGELIIAPILDFKGGRRIMMNEIKEKVENYLSLKKERDRLDNKIRELRNKLTQAVEKAGGEMKVDKFILSIQKRESFEYVPELAKTLLGQYYSIVAEEVVNKRKVAGLIKGGFITEEDLQSAKNITRTTKALVIKEDKNGK